MLFAEPLEGSSFDTHDEACVTTNAELALKPGEHLPG
jgi:hypothetical protein